MTATSDKKISRISTACGPCRSRKARCDGRSPCQKCKEGDREQECVFIHRRGRYRKDQELQLSQAKDRAIKILFKACNAGCGFPGDMPPNLKGQISSTTIMAALGIVSHREDGTVKILDGQENVEIKAQELQSQPLSPRLGIGSNEKPPDKSPATEAFSTEPQSPITLKDCLHPQALVSTGRSPFYINTSHNGLDSKAKYLPSSNKKEATLVREDSDAVSELDMRQQFRRLTRKPTYPNDTSHTQDPTNVGHETSINPEFSTVHNNTIVPLSFWEGMDLDLPPTESNQQMWPESEFIIGSRIPANGAQEQFASPTNPHMPPSYYYPDPRSTW